MAEKRPAKSVLSDGVVEIERVCTYRGLDGGPLQSQEFHGESDARAIWAAIVLALDLDTCRSMLCGKAVRAGNLDAFFFRRALRGRPLPDAESYIVVDAEMLDAVAEAGALPLDTRRAQWAR